MVDQHPVAPLDGDLRQIFMRTVHRVSELQRRNGAPPSSLTNLSNLRRAHVKPRVLSWIADLTENPYRTGQVDLSLGHHRSHSRMLRVVGLKNLLALIGLINRVLFPKGHAA